MRKNIVSNKLDNTSTALVQIPRERTAFEKKRAKIELSRAKTKHAKKNREALKKERSSAARLKYDPTLSADEQKKKHNTVKLASVQAGLGKKAATKKTRPLQPHRIIKTTEVLTNEKRAERQKRLYSWASGELYDENFNSFGVALISVENQFSNYQKAVFSYRKRKIQPKNTTEKYPLGKQILWTQPAPPATESKRKLFVDAEEDLLGTPEYHDPKIYSWEHQYRFLRWYKIVKELLTPAPSKILYPEVEPRVGFLTLQEEYAQRKEIRELSPVKRKKLNQLLVTTSYVFGCPTLKARDQQHQNRAKIKNRWLLPGKQNKQISRKAPVSSELRAAGQYHSGNKFRLRARIQHLLKKSAPQSAAKDLILRNKKMTRERIAPKAQAKTFFTVRSRNLQQQRGGRPTNKRTQYGKKQFEITGSKNVKSRAVGEDFSLKSTTKKEVGTKALENKELSYGAQRSKISLKFRLPLEKKQLFWGDRVIEELAPVNQFPELTLVAVPKRPKKVKKRKWKTRPWKFRHVARKARVARKIGAYVSQVRKIAWPVPSPQRRQYRVRGWKRRRLRRRWGKAKSAKLFFRSTNRLPSLFGAVNSKKARRSLRSILPYFALHYTLKARKWHTPRDTAGVPYPRIEIPRTELDRRNSRKEYRTFEKDRLRRASWAAKDPREKYRYRKQARSRALRKPKFPDYSWRELERRTGYPATRAYVYQRRTRRNNFITSRWWRPRTTDTVVRHPFSLTPLKDQPRSFRKAQQRQLYFTGLDFQQTEVTPSRTADILLLTPTSIITQFQIAAESTVSSPTTGLRVRPLDSVERSTRQTNDKVHAYKERLRVTEFKSGASVPANSKVEKKSLAYPEAAPKIELPRFDPSEKERGSAYNRWIENTNKELKATGSVHSSLEHEVGRSLIVHSLPTNHVRFPGTGNRKKSYARATRVYYRKVRRSRFRKINKLNYKLISIKGRQDKRVNAEKYELSSSSSLQVRQAQNRFANAFKHRGWRLQSANRRSAHLQAQQQQNGKEVLAQSKRRFARLPLHTRKRALKRVSLRRRRSLRQFHRISLYKSLKKALRRRKNTRKVRDKKKLIKRRRLIPEQILPRWRRRKKARKRAKRQRAKANTKRRRRFKVAKRNIWKREKRRVKLVKASKLRGRARVRSVFSENFILAPVLKRKRWTKSGFSLLKRAQIRLAKTITTKALPKLYRKILPKRKFLLLSERNRRGKTVQFEKRWNRKKLKRRYKASKPKLLQFHAEKVAAEQPITQLQIREAHQVKIRKHFKTEDSIAVQNALVPVTFDQQISTPTATRIGLVVPFVKTKRAWKKKFSKKINYIDAESTVVPNEPVEEKSLGVVTPLIPGNSELGLVRPSLASPSTRDIHLKAPTELAGFAKQAKQEKVVRRRELKLLAHLDRRPVLTPRNFLIKRLHEDEIEVQSIDVEGGREAFAFTGYRFTSEVAEATTTFFPALISWLRKQRETTKNRTYEEAEKRVIAIYWSLRLYLGQDSKKARPVLRDTFKPQRLDRIEDLQDRSEERFYDEKDRHARRDRRQQHRLTRKADQQRAARGFLRFWFPRLYKFVLEDSDRFSVLTFNIKQAQRTQPNISAAKDWTTQGLISREEFTYKRFLRSEKGLDSRYYENVLKTVRREDYITVGLYPHRWIKNDARIMDSRTNFFKKNFSTRSSNFKDYTPGNLVRSRLEFLRQHDEVRRGSASRAIAFTGYKGVKARIRARGRLSNRPRTGQRKVGRLNALHIRPKSPRTAQYLNRKDYSFNAIEIDKLSADLLLEKVAKILPESSAAGRLSKLPRFLTATKGTAKTKSLYQSRLLLLNRRKPTAAESLLSLRELDLTPVRKSAEIKVRRPRIEEHEQDEIDADLGRTREQTQTDFNENGLLNSDAAALGARSILQYHSAGKRTLTRYSNPRGITSRDSAVAIFLSAAGSPQKETTREAAKKQTAIDLELSTNKRKFIKSRESAKKKQQERLSKIKALGEEEVRLTRLLNRKKIRKYRKKHKKHHKNYRKKARSAAITSLSIAKFNAENLVKYNLKVATQKIEVAEAKELIVNAMTRIHARRWLQTKPINYSTLLQIKTYRIDLKRKRKLVQAENKEITASLRKTKLPRGIKLLSKKSLKNKKQREWVAKRIDLADASLVAIKHLIRAAGKRPNLAEIDRLEKQQKRSFYIIDDIAHELYRANRLLAINEAKKRIKRKKNLRIKEASWTQRKADLKNVATEELKKKIADIKTGKIGSANRLISKLRGKLKRIKKEIKKNKASEERDPNKNVILLARSRGVKAVLIKRLKIQRRLYLRRNEDQKSEIAGVLAKKLERKEQAQDAAFKKKSRRSSKKWQGLQKVAPVRLRFRVRRTVKAKKNLRRYGKHYLTRANTLKFSKRARETGPRIRDDTDYNTFTGKKFKHSSTFLKIPTSRHKQIGQNLLGSYLSADLKRITADPDETVGEHSEIDLDRVPPSNTLVTVEDAIVFRRHLAEPFISDEISSENSIALKPSRVSNRNLTKSFTRLPLFRRAAVRRAYSRVFLKENERNARNITNERRSEFWALLTGRAFLRGRFLKNWLKDTKRILIRNRWEERPEILYKKRRNRLRAYEWKESDQHFFKKGYRNAFSLRPSERQKAPWLQPLRRRRTAYSTNHGEYRRYSYPREQKRLKARQYYRKGRFSTKTKKQFISFRRWPRLRTTAYRRARSLGEFRTTRAAQKHFKKLRSQKAKTTGVARNFTGVGNRLDVTLRLLGIFKTVFWARRHASLGLVIINKVQIFKANHRLQPGDVLEFDWGKIRGAQALFKPYQHYSKKEFIRRHFKLQAVPGNFAWYPNFNFLIYKNHPCGQDIADNTRLCRWLFDSFRRDAGLGRGSHR